MKLSAGSLRSSKQSLEYKVGSQKQEQGKHIEIFDEVDYDDGSGRGSQSSHSKQSREYHSEALPAYGASGARRHEFRSGGDFANNEGNQSQTIKTLLSQSSNQSSRRPSYNPQQAQSHQIPPPSKKIL